MHKHQTNALQTARACFEEVQEASKSTKGEEYNILKAGMQAQIEKVEQALIACHDAHMKAVGARAEV